jgi:hypothetical protein
MDLVRVLFSVTWWSTAGMFSLGVALGKVAFQLHLAVVASALAALPAKPPISIGYWWCRFHVRRHCDLAPR